MRVDHRASGSDTIAPATVPSTARYTVSMKAVRVRADHIWFQSGCNSRLRISLSPVSLLITVRNEKPVPYFQSTSVASVISTATAPATNPNIDGRGLRGHTIGVVGAVTTRLPTTDGRQHDRTVMLAPSVA